MITWRLAGVLAWTQTPMFLLFVHGFQKCCDDLWFEAKQHKEVSNLQNQLAALRNPKIHLETERKCSLPGQHLWIPVVVSCRPEFLD